MPAKVHVRSMRETGNHFGSRYRSGRSPDLTQGDPAAPLSRLRRFPALPSKALTLARFKQAKL
jgi:hypothetical protein